MQKSKKASEIESTSYKKDLEFTNYCKDNPTNEKCRCIIPEDGIQKLQINTFNPYPCWYAPCKNDITYKTSLILQEQKKCNLVLCEVHLGEVTIDDDGILNVKNNCISSKTVNNVNISQELLENSLKEDYILPNYFNRTTFPLLVALGFILFLKH